MNRAVYFRRKRLRRQAADRRSSRSKIVPALVGATALLATIFVGAVGASIGVGLSIYRSYSKDLIDVSEIVNRQNLGSSQIMDRNGTLLYQFVDPHEGLRNPVTIDKISKNLINATISTEDASFFENDGINLKGLARAGYENFFGGSLFEGSGGSSITQQLVKNVLIPEDERTQRTVDRKVKEVILALEMTKKYSKNQILEWYLNQIFYGNNAYGIEAASRVYFDKRAADLTLPEAAMLAGIPQQPSLYDPFHNLTDAKERQRTVLDLMVQHGAISQAQATQAEGTELVFAEPKKQFGYIKAPHWVFYVRDRLITMFGEDALYRGGLRVTTTLDLRLQDAATAILDEQIGIFETSLACGCHNGSVVVIDNHTGEILVMVGSRDYFRDDIDGEVNNATAINSPGSSFKPIVYLTWYMTQDKNPASIVWSTPYSPGGTPIVEPTSKCPCGPLPSKVALGSSLNITAAKTARDAGIDNVIKTANQLGYTTMTADDAAAGLYGPSIATGGANLTLLEHTYAYSVLANNGKMIGEQTFEQERREDMRKLDPVAILKVTDANDVVLYEYKALEEQVIPAPYAWLITSVISDCRNRVLIWSCGSNLDLTDGRPSAVKTGTQQGINTISEILETWTMGYTPDLTTGVWVGNADNTPVANISSATSASVIWNKEMVEMHRLLDIPAHDFVPPDGVSQVEVTVPIAGGGGTTACSQKETVWVVDGHNPDVEDLCEKVLVDERNDCKATDATPEQFVVERFFLKVPDEEKPWAEQHGLLPPTCESDLTGDEDPRARILNPSDGESFKSPQDSINLRWSIDIDADVVDSVLTVTGPQGNSETFTSSGSGTFNQAYQLRGEGDYTVTLDVTYSREGEDPHTVPTQTATFSYEKRGEPTDTPTPTPTRTRKPRQAATPGPSDVVTMNVEVPRASAAGRHASPASAASAGQSGDCPTAPIGTVVRNATLPGGQPPVRLARGDAWKAYRKRVSARRPVRSDLPV